MALSTIVKSTCKICGKVAIETSRVELGDIKFISLECGHVTTEETIQGADYNSIVSSDGRKLMNYQIEGVKFLEAANGRALLADEQGLGKTVQTAAFIKLHLKELAPAIIVTKTTLKLQWMWEMFRWVDTKKVQVVNSSKEMAVPGMDLYVTTYDMLKVDNLWQYVEPKTLVLDECQSIKDHLSGRAKAVQKIVKSKGIEHVVGLSGTPIKNNAGEYFTILNLLQPTRFPYYDRYIRYYCDSYSTMYGEKIGGLKNPIAFRRETDDFVIRRTKEEVLPDLPKLSRKFHHVELNPKFNAAYAAAYRELTEAYLKGEDMPTKIVILTKMRKITGLSKITECVEFVSDFLQSTERKIVIFHHHHSVRDGLQIKMDQELADLGMSKCLILSAEQSSDTRALTIKNFQESDSRVLIASTLAAGEGLNLQFCSDAVMLERQWNPPNEEQAEARFHRFGQLNPVDVTYMLASETVDDYFTELVEQKRAIFASTMDGKEIQWDGSSLMTELIEAIIRKGGKKWTL